MVTESGFARLPRFNVRRLFPWALDQVDEQSFPAAPDEAVFDFQPEALLPERLAGVACRGA